MQYTHFSTIKYKRIAIIGKHHQAINKASLLQLLHICQEYGYDIFIEYKTAFYNEISTKDGYKLIDMEEITKELNLDFIIVIGGDGTMLGVARELCKENIPLIGINSGRLGFITDINLHDIATYLTPILQGKYSLDERCVLQAQVVQSGNVMFEGLAVNDVVVNRHLANGMIELAISVDGNHMCKQRADGLIVSTPTGSTAYALSVGGPILHPQTDGLVLAPIAPHSLSNRPIVIPSTSNIILQISGVKECMVNFDMQSYTNLQQSDEIHIKQSKYKIIFVHHPFYNYYDVLRKKLHWQDGGYN
jgi:NAD+ kinase